MLNKFLYNKYHVCLSFPILVLYIIFGLYSGKGYSGVVFHPPWFHMSGQHACQLHWVLPNNAACHSLPYVYTPQVSLYIADKNFRKNLFMRAPVWRFARSHVNVALQSQSKSVSGSVNPISSFLLVYFLVSVSANGRL
jgi:hypothetical protein